jgi:hypothetical protein
MATPINGVLAKNRFNVEVLHVPQHCVVSFGYKPFDDIVAHLLNQVTSIGASMFCRRQTDNRPYIELVMQQPYILDP